MAKRSGPDEKAALADLLALAPAADRGRFAGIGLARPLMSARAVQLAREALRARTRFGADDPRARDLALKSERQAVRIARFETEFERAQAEIPKPTPDATVIHGRVIENGRARPGLTVSARGSQGEVRGFGCTDAVGAFTMTVPGEGNIRLRVADKDGAVLHSGTEEIGVAPGRVVYREIRLGETRPDICAPPADDPTGGGRPDVVKVPDLVGRTEAEAVRLLAAVGLKLGTREEADAPDSAGRIVKQDPQAQADVAPGSAVAIVVGARTDLRMPELTGMRLDDARAAIEKASLTIGGLEVTVDQRRQGLVLKQDPTAGTRVEKGSAVALVVGRPETPASPELVLSLAAADARFAAVRLSGDELRAHAERLGLRDRQSLERLIDMPDDNLRDSFTLPALRDAQTLKRVLREALARTA